MLGCRGETTIVRIVFFVTAGFTSPSKASLCICLCHVVVSKIVFFVFRYSNKFLFSDWWYNHELAEDFCPARWNDFWSKSEVGERGFCFLFRWLKLILSLWINTKVVVSNMFHLISPYLGKIPILTSIFQLGWNHQLVYLPCNILALSKDFPEIPGSLNAKFQNHVMMFCILGCRIPRDTTQLRNEGRFFLKDHAGTSVTVRVPKWEDNFMKVLWRKSQAKNRT